MSEIYSIIRDAIANKLQVTAMYNGYYREFCPHVIGTKNGKQQTLVFQFGGTGSKPLPPSGEWRCMEIDKLQDVKAIAGSWHTEPNHSRPQTCVDHIDLEVVF